MTQPQWHQQGSALAYDPRPHGFGTYQTFNEPLRYLDRPDDTQEELLGLPKWAVSLFFRVRNGLSVYNFFFIYCLNAFLNVEIYREYMETHSAEQLYHRTWFENFYIATLAAPLVDVLVRCLARNFLKLNLAKAQSHVGFTASLAICTPSLNAYALLVMRRNPKTILCVMTLDLAEIIYSFYMWTLQPIKTEALWLKLFMLILGSVFWLWDVIALYQYRRFFNRQLFKHKHSRRVECALPPHINPIFVCWDINHSFHWHSANNAFAILERHEDLTSKTFTSAESIAVRKRISEWNEGEEALATIEQQAPSDSPPSVRSSSARSRANEGSAGPLPIAVPPHDPHEEDEEDHRRDSEAEEQALLAARR